MSNTEDDYFAAVINDAEASPSRLKLQPVSAIELKRRTWLWTNRVPLGELTLWVGHAGIGKSQAAVWLASQVSCGTLPGELHGTPSPVLYYGSEDAWSYTLAPRFVAAGADLDRVYRMYAETPTGEDGSVSLAADLDELRDAVKGSGARLVVLDALLSTMQGDDLAKQGTVRRYLEPLSRMAQELNIAVIGVAHFRKSGGADPLLLISGSAEFGQVVRSAIGFARDHDDETGGCVMSLIKTNIAPMDVPSISYRIEPAEVQTADGPTDVGRYVPTGESERHIRELIDYVPTAAEDAEEAADVRGWLHAFLGRKDNGGCAEASEVMKAGKAAGYSADQLKRAKKARGGYPKIHSRKTGQGGWVWSLEPHDGPPERGEEPRQSSQTVSESRFREGGTEGSEGSTEGSTLQLPDL